MWPFDRKKNKAFSPVNRLESLLVDAAKSPHKRGDFFRQIFHFDLVTLGQMSEGGRVRFETSDPHEEGALFIYVFTSKEALQYSLRKSKATKERSFLEMKASSLFEIATLNNLSLIINEGHDYGLILPVAEIKELIDGSPIEEITLEKETQYLLGQPRRDYHPKLIPTLCSFIGQNPEIRDAYLGWAVLESDKNHDGEFYLEIDFSSTTASDRKNIVYEDLYRCINGYLDGKSILISEASKESIESGALLQISSQKGK